MADTLSFNAKVEMVKWYSPSQVLTAKHVSYPQLTATGQQVKMGPNLVMDRLGR